MFRLRTSLATAIMIGIAQLSTARPHYNAWFRATLSVPAGSKIKVDVELQHRRQSGFKNNDPLDKNLMFSVRNWIYYQSGRNVTFSLSPFAWFSNARIIQEKNDENTIRNPEIRIAGAAELQRELLPNFSIVNKCGIEYRVFESTANIVRLRNRLGLSFEWNSHLKVNLYDELLLNVNKTDDVHFYDHNRVGLDVAYTVSQHLKINLGYLYINRLPQSSVTVLEEHNVFLNLAILFAQRPIPKV